MIFFTRRGQFGVCFASVGVGDGHRFGDGGEARRRAFMFAFKIGLSCARRIKRAPRLDKERAGVALKALAFGEGRFRFNVRFGGGGGALFRDGEVFLELVKTVALLKSDCGGGFRLGARDEPVPAPEIALARDETLAGRQRSGEMRALTVVNDADHGEAKRQRRRRRDVTRQGRNAHRQVRGVRGACASAPENRRVRIERREKIVAERCGEGVFIAGFDIDRLNERRPVAVRLTGEDAAQRFDFGADFRKPLLRFLARRAGRLLALLCCGAFFFRAMESGLRRARGFFRRDETRCRRFERLGLFRRRLDARFFLGQLVDLRAGALDAAFKRFDRHGD